MSESEREPEVEPEPEAEEKERPPKAKGADEKVGRALGRMFGRLKQAKIWKDTSQAYQEGLEGKQ